MHVFALRLWMLFGAIRCHIQAFTRADGWVPAFCCDSQKTRCGNTDVIISRARAAVIPAKAGIHPDVEQMPKYGNLPAIGKNLSLHYQSSKSLSPMDGFLPSQE